jgi:1-phosphatidylinositol phosphodiesterase
MYDDHPVGSNWMAKLPNQLLLSQINIPGTHDSCAHNCSLFAKCQTLSLSDQLNAGVRFLDVRCRHVNDEFHLYHSSFSLGADFDAGAIEPCVKFLRANESETILMLVSPEYTAVNNRKEFDDVFLEYIEASREYWYLDDDQMPSLGKTRGKIVLLRRLEYTY